MTLSLKDFYCEECEEGIEDVLIDDLRETVIINHCVRCGKETWHRARCNGGLRSRYRFLDFPDDPEFYRGQVKALGVTAKDSHGEDVKKYTSGSREIGAPVHDDKKFDPLGERREERRDKLKHETRRKRGTLPIVVDQKQG